MDKMSHSSGSGLGAFLELVCQFSFTQRKSRPCSWNLFHDFAESVIHGGNWGIYTSPSPNYNGTISAPTTYSGLPSDPVFQLFPLLSFATPPLPHHCHEYPLLKHEEFKTLDEM